MIDFDDVTNAIVEPTGKRGRDLTVGALETFETTVVAPASGVGNRLAELGSRPPALRRAGPSRLPGRTAPRG